MSKKIISYYILIVIIQIGLTVSCKNNEKKNNINTDVKKLVFSEIRDSIPISKFYRKVKYVTLETKENSLIGSVAKVIVANNRILVWDDQQNALFLFDISGKHMATAKLSGKGPMELIKVSDCDFNPITKEYAAFGNQNRLVFFDQNLKPIGDQSLQYQGIHFSFLDKGYALNTHFYLNTAKKDDPVTQVLIIDQQSKILNRFFSNPIAKVIHHSPSLSFFRSNGVIFTLPCSDKMLWIKSDQVEEWEIDFGKYNHNYEDLYVKAVKGEIDFDNIFYEKDKISFFTHAYLVNDLLHFKGIYNRKYVTCFYDLKNQKSYAQRELYNDLNGFPIGRIKAATNDCFVYMIPTEEVYESALNDSLKLDLTANPILAFYYE